jgi:uncharacterized membrane protein YeaQ/YmgE (transglycosylase-associated protein family)
MFHYLWMLIVGIAAGFIARALMPGNDKMGLLLTGGLGIARIFVSDSSADSSHASSANPHPIQNFTPPDFSCP